MRQRNCAGAVLLLVILSLLACLTVGLQHYSKGRMLQLREEVRAMFQHAYEGYLKHASNYDELRPLTCDGVDTWGSYSLTLIDALDTLATMGNYTEFRRVALLLEQTMDFDKDINVSVFETNIRIVGGLLSAHLLSKRAGLSLEKGWPCQGPLLRMAEDVARRLLPAFDTATGMPYGTVNLRYGVPKDETTITCTAAIGTFFIEFGALSRLTGNSIYEEVALNAVHALWERRSPIGLFGNHIDVQTGLWTALDSGIGAGVDSFFEYLVKGSILLNRPELLEMFNEARQSIDKYLKRDDWYIWAGMTKGQVTLPVFQSLEAFWPGLLSLVGDIGSAMRTLGKYSTVWRKYGFLPEFYNIYMGETTPNRESYPLRPELVESAMYLYRATKNEFLLELGELMLRSIEFSAKTKCGYATIRNVVNHEKENRMESFFLAETTKYLYLLFDEDNFLHNDGGHGERVVTPHGVCIVNAGAYIFNTEAHPVDMSALHCCHDMKEDIYDGLDLAQFQDAALLKVEREKILSEAELNPKYQCAYNASDVHHERPSVKRPEGNVSVDIEVFDENNEPAAQVLIDNFERIRAERRQASANTESIRRKGGLSSNQVTVSDLEDFFQLKRNQFVNADHVLKYVVQYMRNFTLDASFIRGLEILDKKLTTTLGIAAQREYESTTRSLWELYAKQCQYVVNARLVEELGLSDFRNEDQVMLEKVLIVLKSFNETDRKPFEDQELAAIAERFTLAAKDFNVALVNVTAMQDFLLKVLTNGTTDTKRYWFMSLLTDGEITSLAATPYVDEKDHANVFSYVQRIVVTKKQMIEVFSKLQTLMQENNSSTTAATPDATTAATPAEVTTTPPQDDAAPSDELIIAAGGEPTFVDQSEEIKAEYPLFAEVASSMDLHQLNAPLKAAVQSIKDSEEGKQSVWSQLVQSILRKTTVQRKPFDAELLAQKTRNSLQKYSQKTLNYELFTCQRPRFVERFAYRDFYPY